jgi:pimeloyl-ACP methyl ester carboxylesterase
MRPATWAPRRITLVAVVASLALVAAACTGSGPAEPFHPTFQSTPCPDDVTAVLVVPVSCGYLTVLEDRSGGSDRTIRLFITKVEPVGGHPAPDPVVILSGDMGTQPEYGGLSPHFNRVEYIIDARGSGHSEPSLACPEVEQLAASLLEVPISDPSARADLTDGVTTCRDRLNAEGIDLSAYTIKNMAADVEDLRQALGIDEWDLQSWTSNARVMLEVMKDYPEHIRTSVLISPEFPQLDPISEGIAGTNQSVDLLAAACKAQSACDRKYPDVGRALSEAIARLDAHPATLVERSSLAAAQAGHPFHVLIDGGMLLRIVRAALAYEGGASIGPLPRILYAVRNGHVPPSLLTVAGSITSAPALCVGLSFDCRPQRSDGTFFSVLCHDELPFVDRDALASSAIGDTAAQEDFVASPYFDVCEAWAVGSADPSEAQPVTSDIPTLFIAGQFDPFSAVPEIRTASQTFTNGHVIVTPWQTTNPNGSLECPRSIRTAWWNDPTSQPDTHCFAQIPPIRFG